jgi:hypothetical protein
MSEIILSCPDCGQDRAFAQHHSGAAGCPDATGGDCPEWYCLVCGATMLTGATPILLRPSAVAAGRARVA